MTILTLIFLLFPALSGITIVSNAKLVQEKMTAILIGSIVGIAILTTIAYVISTLLIFTPISLGILAAASALPIIFLGNQAWTNWRAMSLDRVSIVIIIITALLFTIIGSKLLIEKPDGLYTGIINAYGDVAWHLSNITMFAQGQTVPPENPIFSGTRLTYPFMANALSGFLLTSGATIQQSLTLPAIIFIPILLTLLYFFYKEATQRKSAAIIALLLFLFGGAVLGWTRFPDWWQKSQESLPTFLYHLPNTDFSGVGTDQAGYHFLNPITSLILPQRSLLLGFPLAFSILLLLLSGARKRNPHSFLAAGIIAGILPLFHAHTVLALTPTILAFAFYDLWKNRSHIKNSLTNWLLFATPAALIGIPEVLYYIRGSAAQPGSFFRFAPGWMMGDHNFLWYWFKNTGLFIPIAILGLFLKTPPRLKVLCLSGLLLFTTANIWLFAPWVWDNYKIFVYFLLLVLPIIAWLVSEILLTKKSPAIQLIIIALLGLHMLSAALDITKLALPTSSEYKEWSTTDLQIAQRITQVTKRGSSIITAPTHNSAVVLAGRPRYLGYAAHVWSHGLIPWTREKALPNIYQGSTDNIPENRPDYIFIGPQERAQYQITVNPTWQLIFDDNNYQLYRLP